MKKKSLAEFLQLKSQTISVRSLLLTSQSAYVVAFSNEKLYELIKDEEEDKQNGEMVVLDCSDDWRADTGDSSVEIISCETFDAVLRGLAELAHYDSERELRSIVVANLSVFYFQLKKQSFTQLHELVNCVNVVRRKYNCCVVVTGWDTQFEGGFNKGTQSKGEPLTYLPGWFLESFDLMVSLENVARVVNTPESDIV